MIFVTVAYVIILQK